jgi:hypothetical protein
MFDIEVRLKPRAENSLIAAAWITDRFASSGWVTITTA